MRLNRSQGLRPKQVSGVAVSVKQCRNCDLIFADPQPVPPRLSDHYGIPPQEYWRAVPDWNPGHFSEAIETVRRLLPGKSKLTALDIGVGLGLTMRSLAHAGFDTWGLEPAEPFYEHALNNVRPGRLKLATVEEADFPEGSFDFITFGAVLEHLYSPSLALDKAMSWLKPGGIIHAEVPNSRWLIAKLVNQYFRLSGTTFVTHISPMHPPFHLYEFGLGSFKNYEIAEYSIHPCEVMHVPKVLHRPLKWLMDITATGMQIVLYLRKPISGENRQ
jgi:SAM-dependent methyltransferase